MNGMDELADKVFGHANLYDEPGEYSCETCGDTYHARAHPFRDGKYILFGPLCETCLEEKGRQEKEQEELRLRQEAKDNRFKRGMAAAGIPDLPIKEAELKGVKLLPWFERFVTKSPRGAFEKDGDHVWGLYVHGKPGTGKTLQAALAIQAYVRHWANEFTDVTARYCYFPSLLAQAKRGFNDESQRVDWAVYETCDLLIIDDLGREGATPYNGEVIDQLIEARYSGMRRTVFVSNSALQDLTYKGEGDGHANYDDRLTSRIYHMLGGKSPAILRLDHQYRTEV